MRNTLLACVAGLAALGAGPSVMAEYSATRAPGSLARPATQGPGQGGDASNVPMAQSNPPSWQMPPAAAPRGNTPQQPTSGSGPVGNERALASNPPADHDCKSIVTKANPEYAIRAAGGFSTDGTEDHGRILNEVANTGRYVQVNLEDLQVRIEQLRCEDQNIKAKLDYLIRMRTP